MNITPDTSVTHQLRPAATRLIFSTINGLLNAPRAVTNDDAAGGRCTRFCFTAAHVVHTLFTYNMASSI
jgi:hypothetical protein